LNSKKKKVLTKEKQAEACTNGAKYTYADGVNEND
jgi:hypothetical protein